MNGDRRGCHGGVLSALVRAVMAARCRSVTVAADREDSEDSGRSKQGRQIHMGFEGIGQPFQQNLPMGAVIGLMFRKAG